MMMLQRRQMRRCGGFRFRGRESSSGSFFC
jgi:hypothetical protein